MNGTDVITVRGLHKAYGTRVVVNHLDLDVHAGEIVGLVGANGAGKTTTVECIQGLRRPDGGTLRVLGYDPVTQAALLRPCLGSQLQDSALPDRMRVAEAVELFAARHARDGGELLDQFGLTARRRSAFSALSGGERQDTRQPPVHQAAVARPRRRGGLRLRPRPRHPGTGQAGPLAGWPFQSPRGRHHWRRVS